MGDTDVLSTWPQVRSLRQLHGLACAVCARPIVSARQWRAAVPRPVALSRTGSPLLACTDRGCAALATVVGSL